MNLNSWVVSVPVGSDTFELLMDKFIVSSADAHNAYIGHHYDDGKLAVIGTVAASWVNH